MIEETLPLQDEQVVETHQEHPETHVVAQPQEKTPSQSFKDLRDKTERIERERDEAIQKLAQFQAKAPEPEEDLGLKPDELAEGKHLNKVAKEIRQLKEQLKTYQEQTIQTTLETRIKSQYPDFDAVVSKDNVDILKETYPELAATLNASSDIYNKAASAYTLIKKLGIHQDNSFELEKSMAQKNAVKPKPVASLSPQQGDSPLSRANAFANGLTEELKSQLYKEMIAARKAN